MKNALKQFADGVLAGLMIVIGCAVYLACESKVVGAVMFSVALLTICYFGFSLFTGKVGFMVNGHSKTDFSVLFLGLLGNVVGTALFGYLLGLSNESLVEKAVLLCSGKLEQEFYQTLIRAVFCGVLMYVAVWVFKERKSVSAILLCVPVFILSGFEHSIADMGFFAVTLTEFPVLESFAFILIVIVGNSIGGMLIPFVLRLTCLKTKDSEEGTNAKS